MKKILFSLLFAFFAAFAAWFGFDLNSHPTKSDTVVPHLETATVLKPTNTISTFSLKGSDGSLFTNQSFKGYWTLIFFGYSDCPDICPRTLSQISDIYKILAENHYPAPKFVFVSLDPNNDTPEKLHSFLARFNPSFIGLTGNELEMKKLAEACRIYSWTDPTPNSAGQKIIDHSATLLLINPKGQLQALFSPPFQPTAMVKDLQTLTNM